MLSKNNTELGPAIVTLLVVAVFLVVHVLLSYIGLVPSEVSEFNQRVIERVSNLHRISYQRPAEPILPRAELSAEEREQLVGEIPNRIMIDKIGVDMPISSPEEASISTLDAALNEGVVHYPGSGGIGGSRRMFLFGHSSRLPVVQNQAYKSFNGLDKLVAGDEVSVFADGELQTYRVTSVKVVDKDEALVSFIAGAGKLTLSTCTTFGARENRVVVEAELTVAD
ncbi:MAG: sortase [Candidatus Paceibacterota bacterium]